jgi:hypothetical protein
MLPKFKNPNQNVTTNLRIYFLKFGDFFPKKKGTCNLFFLTFERNLPPRKKGFEYQPSFSQVWESI